MHLRFAACNPVGAVGCGIDPGYAAHATLSVLNGCDCRLRYAAEYSRLR